MSKGKLLNIEVKMPEQVRFNPSEYFDLIVDIRKKGGNPWTLGELRILYDNLDDVRIVTDHGWLMLFYEKETITFDFYAGFAHNTSSVPDILKFIKDNDDRDMYIAGLPHDGVYTGHQMSKGEIDGIFVDIIEYFHDSEGDEGFFENLIENTIEKGIEIAFGTDEAMKCWEQGKELAPKSGAMMRVTREKIT